jgi:hypothetical protein
MPINKYYHAHGKEVMKDMEARYGDKAERVFYATANKKKQKPKSETRSKIERAMEK